VNAKQTAAVGIVIALVAIIFVASAYAGLLSGTQSATSQPDLSSAVHASLGATADAGTVSLRLDRISDASDPATNAAWIALNREANDAIYLYNYSLTPPPGDRYLVATVTVTNLQSTEVPFSYPDFVLMARDNSSYYPNYAVCNASCAASALENSTLTGSSTNDLLVLFSVPAAAQPAGLAYTGSSPPVVMAAT